ncbi:CoB--CoM heterodisulfide reductase subunit A fused to methylviologen reducing hydrogenase subunit delta [Dissulfuribacter thermophilus]|uniref:CoB--CoM heterodisulfide reductase subunit A fused to methylviologen reducing hydrogenase subunit delta n=1 Tax=Dissulfuribacter thermophilus TaxID=1156395 RepID=A0A1B9F8Q4_9BACT|nr:CoB--CoM heterodisulfide reductase subunit A fused to methylviologen reducing hydrogenase subunit delta [Dissulfuribacter thermophilus]
MSKICIIGGGIAGIQCALDLSEAGLNVIIVESGDALGGISALLDKTFPTNDCSMCTLAPKLVDLSQRPNVEILTRAEINGIHAEEGEFTIAVTLNPRFVDEKKCISCGRCEDVCPVFVTPQGATHTLRKKAISIPFPQAIPNSFVLNPKACLYFLYGSCKKCEAICPTKAINLEETKVGTRIKAQALVIATGAGLFDPTPLKALGYKTLPNVITNLEMELMLKATGPTGGKVLRPSDRKEPQSVAWIQCVGSRMIAPLTRPFCSDTCCMSSVKEALNTKEVCHKIVTDIYFLDLRAHQKGSEIYYQKAKALGVNFIRSRICSLDWAPGDKIELRARRIGGTVESRTYDLVVLATGRSPSQTLKQFLEQPQKLYDDFGFIATKGEETFKTPIGGIYACGSSTSPKSIPHSVIEGSAAAGAVIINMSHKSDNSKYEHPSTLNCSQKSPAKIGVFICKCGGNISDHLPVESLKQASLLLDGVEHCEIVEFACSKDALSIIKEQIKNKGLNRIVVAACSPHTHEATFQEAIKPLGLGPWAISMANIRNHNAWVHKSQPILAEEKAKDQIRIEIERVRKLKPIAPKQYPVIKEVLIIGGGISGMKCAIDFARLGFPVTLLEKEKELGGNARFVHKTWRGTFFKQLLKDLTERVQNHPKITVLTEAKLLTHTGRAGSFTSKIETKEKGTIVINHGVTVVATGAKEFRPDEYLYGDSKRILTHLELDRILNSKEDATKIISKAKEIAFIQCVGSREENRPYCSRVCCTHTIMTALLLKEINPALDIFIFYRQMRTYGLREKFFLEAKKKGVHMIPFSTDHKPIVKKILAMDETGQVSTKLKLSYQDPYTNQILKLYPDLVILASAIVPDLRDNKELSDILGIPLDEEGFFKEAHLKLRPVETIQKGIFITGLAQFPKELDETFSQCSAVVSRATASILSKDTLLLDTPIARVIKDKCDGCGLCVDPCPFRAIKIIEYIFKKEVKRTIEIEEANCTGCGICVATCPKEGIEVSGFEPSTILSQIDAIIKERNNGDFEPYILGFLCHWCAYASADLAGAHKIEYPANVRFIRVMCTGTVNPNIIVYALSRGIDGVIVLGCHPGECHYHKGNLVALERKETIELILEEYGISPERYLLDWCSSGQAERFVNIVTEFVEKIKDLGPNTHTITTFQPPTANNLKDERRYPPMTRCFDGVLYYWDGHRYRSSKSAQRSLKKHLDKGFEVKLIPEENVFLIYTRKEINDHLN